MSPRAGLTEEVIIQAAMELADTAGITAVTLANLAAKLQVRSPSLYNHIAGLPDLRSRIAAHGLEKLYNALSAAISGHAEEQPRARIQRLCLAYISFARLHPGVYLFTQQDADDEGDDRATHYREQLVTLCLQTLAPLGLQHDDCIHAVRGLRSLLHGFAVLDTARGFAMPLALEDSLPFIVDVYISGLACRAEGGQ